MTIKEEQALYEREKENNIRYIRAKLPYASTSQLAFIASFISELGIAGWSESEYKRII